MIMMTFNFFFIFLLRLPVARLWHLSIAWERLPRKETRVSCKQKRSPMKAMVGEGRSRVSSVKVTSWGTPEKRWKISLMANSIETISRTKDSWSVNGWEARRIFSALPFFFSCFTFRWMKCENRKNLLISTSSSAWVYWWTSRTHTQALSLMKIYRLCVSFFFSFFFFSVKNTFYFAAEMEKQWNR